MKWITREKIKVDRVACPWLIRNFVAVTEDELQPVLKSLLKNKINIVAIHQHMTHEEPRITFFHYWGRRPAKAFGAGR